eukprot:Phypoly_transcript_01676.p1 GENE.Phypoly_transcript_01676~~Phypoly_transcript_01676.p1  ORF type:complete len:873 (+),score=105.89 Phypoly_transcript_01676:492-3110(+)
MSRSFYQHITLTGTVVELNNDGANFLLWTRSGDEFYVYVSSQTWFKSLRNLDEQAEASRDRYADPPSGSDYSPIGRVNKYLAKGAFVTIEGVLSVNELKRRVDARTVHLLYQQDNYWIGEKLGKVAFEGSHWWLSQLTGLADGWLQALWPNESDKFDFDSYLSNLDITFRPTNNRVQESATLSRLIFGLSSAFLLTGCVRYFDAAKAGVEFLRKNFRSTSSDGRVVIWASKRVKGVMMIKKKKKNDKNAIPLYEQIYCLAGLTQFYRITQDWGVLDDIMKTVYGFQKHYHDAEYKGWYSHLDYATLSPHSACLGENQSRKNWNSIGDHLPAYLLNLILALDPIPDENNKETVEAFLKTCKEMLKEATNLIADKFPEKDVNYVQERFFRDWKPDRTYGWQQNRAIVGHNLKIAWNLTRVANFYDNEKNKDPEVDTKKLIHVAEKLARDMVKVGAVDLHRGGCFDAVERQPTNGQTIEFTWSNTKDFWQQEQGILAYYILYGRTQDSKYLDYARDMTAFWNVFFLDHDTKSTFFRTTDDGLPLIKDGYGAKAGHAIAGYHAFELNFLAHIYISAYVTNKPFVLYFLPTTNTTNVLPDGFSKHANLKITRVTSNGIEISTYENFTVKCVCPQNHKIGAGHTLAVQFTPDSGLPHKATLRSGVSSGHFVAPPPVPKVGKIGVIVESHFDETEVRKFDEEFPKAGYEVEYLSYLWGNRFAYYTGNDHNDPLYVFKEMAALTDEQLKQYSGFIFIGGYAMDRLRYEVEPKQGQENQSVAAKFLRRIAAIPSLKIGVICHSLWLFCATKGTLEGRKVTCANNILYDVINAGGLPVYKKGGVGLVETHVDNQPHKAALISGQHPGVIDEFVKVYLAELNK